MWRQLVDGETARAAPRATRQASQGQGQRVSGVREGRGGQVGDRESPGGQDPAAARGPRAPDDLYNGIWERATQSVQESTIPAEPPANAFVRPDGSRVQLHGESTLVRWTCRGNGSWRKPELFPLDQEQLQTFQEQLRRYEAEQEAERLRKEEEEREAAEAARRKRAEKLAAAPAAVAAQKAAAAAAAAGNAAETIDGARLAELLSLREPPEDATGQSDGSFQLALEVLLTGLAMGYESF
ncbi:unnamed protein product [Symbiodinium natans]|uniref:Uncharacterized protein n=1 Tax=Symbiodinium natans TaxID=878477 RepID=A0A812RI21_9DINO|nr:unnamed protein product [Symbiodinium natans]